MKKVELDLSCVVDGRTWNLYAFDWTGPDGHFCGYLHAVSMEHAAAMLADMKETAALNGMLVEADI